MESILGSLEMNVRDAVRTQPSQLFPGRLETVKRHTAEDSHGRLYLSMYLSRYLGYNYVDTNHSIKRMKVEFLRPRILNLVAIKRCYFGRLLVRQRYDTLLPISLIPYRLGWSIHFEISPAQPYNTDSEIIHRTSFIVRRNIEA